LEPRPDVEMAEFKFDQDFLRIQWFKFAENV
jgi:hypothetical protein